MYEVLGWYIWYSYECGFQPHLLNKSGSALKCRICSLHAKCLYVKMFWQIFIYSNSHWKIVITRTFGAPGEVYCALGHSYVGCSNPVFLFGTIIVFCCWEVLNLHPMILQTVSLKESGMESLSLWLGCIMAGDLWPIQNTSNTPLICRLIFMWTYWSPLQRPLNNNPLALILELDRINVIAKSSDFSSSGALHI